MSRFPKLTEGQREPLLRLVEYQEARGKEQVFVLVGGSQARIEPLGIDKAVVEEVATEIVLLWHDMGYVHLGSRSMGPTPWEIDLPSFVLCDGALDYKRRQSYGHIRRGLAGMLDTWATDLRTAVLVVGAAVIAAVLTSILMKALGLS